LIFTDAMKPITLTAAAARQYWWWCVDVD